LDDLDTGLNPSIFALIYTNVFILLLRGIYLLFFAVIEYYEWSLLCLRSTVLESHPRSNVSAASFAFAMPMRLGLAVPTSHVKLLGATAVLAWAFRLLRFFFLLHSSILWIFFLLELLFYKSSNKIKADGC